MDTGYQPQKNNLPTLSVVVPSYNQAQYLEETLLSIIGQGYPGLELIVIDGGSTDGSVDILRKYDSRIAYWVSEPDRGQSHAINKGLEKATGEWVAWMNSDDCYLPNTLVKFFQDTDHRQYDFMHGLCSSGESIQNRKFRQINRNAKRNAFGVLRFFMGTEFIIPSQSAFVRRSILKQVGLLTEHLNWVMDMDWFARIMLFTQYRRRYYYNYTICFYRKHPLTKTYNNHDKVYAEACGVALKYAPNLPGLQGYYLRKLVNSNRNFRECFAHCNNIWAWVVLVIKFPLHARYSIGFWARLKQLCRELVGLPAFSDQNTTK